MASVQAQLRARIWQILTEGAGAPGHTIPVGRFRRLPDDKDLGGSERGVEVMMRTRSPLGEYNSPTCGQGLYLTTVQVVVHYLLARGDTSWEATGDQSGGGDTEQVEDRAADDGQVITAALGYQPSWSTITDVTVVDPGAVIPTPPPAPLLEMIDAERATCTITMQILTRADQYTAFGPTV